MNCGRPRRAGSRERTTATVFSVGRADDALNASEFFRLMNNGFGEFH